MVVSLCGAVPSLCGLTICVVVSTLCNVVSLIRIRVYFRCQVLFPRSLSSLRTRLSSFFWCLVPTLGIKDGGSIGGRRERSLLSLLEKLHLGHLLENFQREKVTVDQICKLSDKQIECLGVNYRNTKVDQICKFSDKQIECLGVNYRNTMMTL